MRASFLAVNLVFFVPALGAGPVLAQSSSPRYAVTDVGDLGGGETIASAINASGQVVGTSFLAGHTLGNGCDERRGFLYEGGVMTELPSLPGTKWGSASGISDAGDVAGTDYVYVPDERCTGGCFPGYCEAQTPVLRRSSGVTDLSAPYPWYAGVANDVNGHGQVVGWSRKADLPNPRTWHAYLWEDGVRTDLGTLETDWSIASGINDDGLVVGYSQLVEGSGQWYGFRWSGGSMSPLPPLGTNTYNGANDVNAAGDAVGWSGPSSAQSRPVFYPSTGGVVDLVGLGGATASAFALNGSGSVVGYATLAGGPGHAFLYRDGQIWDLNGLIPAGSGWELAAATDINDLGQIVGYGCKDSRILPSGACEAADGTLTFRRAFLLSPVPSIGGIRELILSFGLPQGLERSLLAKLVPACGPLGALAQEVDAQSGKGLTASQAAQILQAVAILQADLGCA